MGSDLSREQLIEDIKGMIVALTVIPASIARTDRDEDAVYDRLAGDIVAVFERAHGDLAGRIGRGIVAVQNGESEEVILGMLRGEAYYEHNSVVFEGAGSFLTVASDVQETAHTDDEREALASLIQAGRYSGRVFPAENPADFRDADRILAAGFHRTVQGEPSDDEREALALLIDPNALELHAKPWPLDAADRVLAGSFHRTAQRGPESDDLAGGDRRPRILGEECG